MPHASRLTFSLCLLLGCLFLAIITSAQQTIAYQDYLLRIGRWREQVRVVQVQERANCAQVLNAIAAELAGITAVQMPNGSTMSVNHEGIITALRAAPCDAARADSLLAGVCPNQVCPVAVLPPNPTDPDSADTLPLTNPPPSLPGTPAADAAQQLEELLQEGQPGAAEAGPAESGAEQPAFNATPGSQNESDQVGAAAGGNESAGSGGATAATGATPSAAAGETAAGSATAESGSASTGEAGAANETGSEAGSSPEGSEAATASAAAAGGSAAEASSSGQTAGEAGQAAAGEAGQAAAGSEGAGTSAATAAAAEITAATTAAAPAATSQPPEMTPPVASASSPWLWAIIGLAIIIIIVGAILFILSQPGAEGEGKGKSQEPETAAEAVDEGRELIAAGNYRGAIRHLFLAALLTLDERNLIQYDKTRTNYELLDEADLRSPIVETLMPVVETFERVWYGFEAVGAAEYEQLVGQIELLKKR